MEMSDSMEEFDAVLIGAGLAGLQCARLLAREGVRVLLADAKRDLSERVHTTGIFVRRTLEDFTLPADCLGPPVRRVTLYSPARRAQTFESAHVEFRVGRMGRLYGRLLAECRNAGVEWRPATRYVSCETKTPDARTLVSLERDGLTRQVATRFLIGADGARSRVARDLELDCNREWIVGVEEVYAGATLQDEEPQFHCFLDPRLAPGYLAWVVEDGEETHVGVGGYAERFDASRALAEFRSGLSDRFGLTRARLVERRGGRIPVGGVLGRIANERGLLVGDAAGAVSPLTAGGLDPALRLSTLAARVASEYLRTNDVAALAPYSGARFRARFTSRLWMRRMARGMSSPLLVEAACAALRVPPFDRVARHVFFGRGSFPDVGLATATQAEARGAA
jgi:flavin-dependent dehydrogenase